MTALKGASARRLAVAGLAAVLSAGCAETVEQLSPRYFFGPVTDLSQDEVCLGDPRDEEPERERCFVLEGVPLPEGTELGTVLKIRYEDLNEDAPSADVTDVAVEIAVVSVD